MRRLAIAASIAVLAGTASAGAATRQVPKTTRTVKPAPKATTPPTAPATTAAGGGALTKPVTIRFENYNLATAGPGRDATLKLIGIFEKKNPLIKVDTKATPDQQMFQSIQAEVAAGAPPDIAQLVLREWDQNVENFPIVVLEDSPLIGPAALQAHLTAGHAYHPKAAALTQRNGKTYGLSYVFSTPTLFYNANLFRQAGLDPDKPPRTWEEVESAANRVQIIGNKQGSTSRASRSTGARRASCAPTADG